ncbi:MAG TPA: hypothetical protein VEJ16_01735 [Alphaproteobacteria bacterium]|nr:hypothetical protein [Alphaproteobacteria bacterium]
MTTPSSLKRTSTLARIVGSLVLLAAVSGCVVEPLYAPPPHYHYYYGWR